jgi:predicted ester cyclase
MRGPADVRDFTAAMWRAMPDMHFTEPMGLLGEPDGDRAAVPWRMTATFTGPLDPPGFAPTGDRVEVEGVDVFEVRDGRIARLATHYDLMNIARQTGVLPPRGSRGERAAARLQRAAAKLRRR